MVLPAGNAHGHSESEILILPFLLGLPSDLFFFGGGEGSGVAHCLKCSFPMNQSLRNKGVKAQGQYRLV